MAVSQASGTGARVGITTGLNGRFIKEDMQAIIERQARVKACMSGTTYEIELAALVAAYGLVGISLP